jgi:hypothetical protein
MAGLGLDDRAPNRQIKQAYKRQASMLSLLRLRLFGILIAWLEQQAHVCSAPVDEDARERAYIESNENAGVEEGKVDHEDVHGWLLVDGEGRSTFSDSQQFGSHCSRSGPISTPNTTELQNF